MLDSDLAKLYGVTTSNLNKAVKRNSGRFPGDFMCQLTADEVSALRFHLGMSKSTGRGGRRYRPYAFTEQGVAMLSSALHSERAIQVNIAIMCAFVKLREALALHKELAKKLEALERSIIHHDAQIRSIFDAIRRLMTPPEQPKRRIGFHSDWPTVDRVQCFSQNVCVRLSSGWDKEETVRGVVSRRQRLHAGEHNTALGQARLQRLHR